MGLEPTRQYWPGHLGLAWSDCGTSSASTKSKISCDSGVLALNDSDLLICLDIKIKDTRKTNVLYTGAGNGTWTHTPILTQAPQACLSADSSIPANQLIYYSRISRFCQAQKLVFCNFIARKFPANFQNKFTVQTSKWQNYAWQTSFFVLQWLSKQGAVKVSTGIVNPAKHAEIALSL